MKTLITSKLFIFLFTLCLMGGAKLIAQPANDLIANAIDLNYGPLPYNSADVNFPEATFTVDGSSIGCSQVVAGIWYKFYATKTGAVSAFIQTNSGAMVTFYQSFTGNVTNANQINYVDQPANICGFGNFSQIEAIGGTYYYIFMRNEAISNVAINVSNAFAALENDVIPWATEVDINNPNNTYPSIHFLTATNLSDGGQAGCDTGDIAGIWYKFYSEVAMDVSASMSSDANISAIIFYKSLYGGDANSSDLEHVAQDQNLCGIQNNARITTEAENWYYIFASTLEPYANVIVESMVLDITDNKLEGFSFYPNPVSHELNLSAKNNIDEVAIYNLLGQKVHADLPNQSRKSIDMSFLQTGMYIMNITSEGKTASYKIIKK